MIGRAVLRDHHGVTGEVQPGGAGVQWHIDGYYDGDSPPVATQLFCVEAPPKGTGGVLQLPTGEVAYEGGATIFADTHWFLSSGCCHRTIRYTFTIVNTTTPTSRNNKFITPNA